MALTFTTNSLKSAYRVIADSRWVCVRCLSLFGGGVGPSRHPPQEPSVVRTHKSHAAASPLLNSNQHLKHTHTHEAFAPILTLPNRHLPLSSGRRRRICFAQTSTKRCHRVFEMPIRTRHGGSLRSVWPKVRVSHATPAVAPRSCKHRDGERLKKWRSFAFNIDRI